MNMHPSLEIKKIILIVLALSVFSILYIQTEITLAHEDQDKNMTIIHVDENGFIPYESTVTVGNVVIFENVGTEEHWPASDDHPSHTLYDNTSLDEHCSGQPRTAFDSCGSISVGETWQFVFEKAGTFEYHDHLWPHLDGKIIVIDEDDESMDGKNVFSHFFNYLRSTFTKLSSFFIDYEEELILNSGNVEDWFYEDLIIRYENIVLERDPREAIRTLQRDSSNDARVSALCHDILHEIGATAYRKYGSFMEATKFQSDFCNSGYIHGVFESYFDSASDPLSGLAEQCKEYASLGGRQFDLWQCHHGIGHGFMYLTGGNLDESLSLCERGLGRDGTASCQNGVFMEVFNLEILGKESSYIDPEDPFLTCSSRDNAKGDCYLYTPTYLSQTKEMEFSEILEECSRAEFGYEDICIRGVGSEVMKRNMHNPSSVFALCKQAGSFINQNACVGGVAAMYMNQTGSYSAGKKLCRESPQEFRDICNNTVRSRESFFR